MSVTDKLCMTTEQDYLMYLCGSVLWPYNVGGAHKVGSECQYKVSVSNKVDDECTSVGRAARTAPLREVAERDLSVALGPD